MRGRSSKSSTRGQFERVVIDAAEETKDAVIALLNQLQHDKPVIVLLETAPTTGRVFWQGRDFYRTILKRCHELRIPVVIDEVACGAYRHGWYSAFEWLTEYPPAAVVLAKGLTSGMYPMSCVLLRSDVATNLESMERLPAFTFGLTDPGAWFALEVFRVVDELEAYGRFESRKALVKDAVEFLDQNGFKGRLESTDTTLRLAYRHSDEASGAKLELREQGLTTYSTSAVLGGAPESFIFCCPPLDLDQDLSALLFDKFCSAVVTAQS